MKSFSTKLALFALALSPTLANATDIQACKDGMNAISASLGTDQTLSLMCTHLTRDFDVTNPVIKKCITQAAATAGPLFWFYEDSLIRKNGIADSIPERWMQECGRTTSDVAKAKVKLYSRTVFHSLTPVKDDTFAIGGISGIAWDSHQNLIAASDDRVDASIHFFRLVQRKSQYPLQIEYNRTARVGSSIIDMEDVVVDSQGQLIVTSEEIPGRSFVTGFKNTKNDPVPKSYVFKLSPDGKFISDVQIPDELYSQTLEKDAQCSTNTDDFGGFFGALSRLFSGKKKQPNHCKGYAQANGIQYNKGLEALTISSDKSYLFFGPEQPLVGTPETGPGTEIPLYMKDLQTEQTTKYRYPLSTDVGNGLVALLALKPFQLLTMERGYNPETREGTLRIYKVELNPRRTEEILTKTLIFDMETLKAQMAVGFDKIDNFEGIAIGPKLPNGNPSLILVSDNNKSTKQRTDFIILDVAKDLLR